ncbi:MAG: InlB B-repeat-containing protein, partial [Clostridia bacterium]|nr:InlB B-repeat-containing protein [Clostridia bacterium]
MRNSVKKSLSVLLSLLMVLSVFGGLTLTSGAAAPDDSKLLGRFFSTSDFRYDAVSGTNVISPVTGSDPVYNAGTGFTTISDSGYLQINKQDLYAGVNENTGLSVAATYYSSKDEPHEHLISSGASAYDGSTVARHFYIAATYLGAGTQYRSLFLEWAGPGGNDQKTIRCYADGLTFEANKTYDIIVTFSVNEGVVYTVNGKRYAAFYMDSSYAAQKENIRAFLNDVANYQYHYIGRSRWGADGNFGGGIKDMRLYRDNLTSDPLLGRFFSTDNVWYDAVTEDPNGLISKVSGGSAPSYNASTGFTTLNTNNYLQVSNPGLFAGVTPETGLTLAFTYRPTQNEHYVQLLSFGKNTYEENNQGDHFYIGATFHDTYRDSDIRNPLVFEWRLGSTSQVIAWPQGLAFSAGTTYDVVISISAAEGVVYTVNGVKYNTRYYAGNKADLNTFLNAVPGYKYGYIGRSRWIADTQFAGDMKDFRLYKTAAQPSNLLGHYFSTSNVWYDAVTNDPSGLEWRAGDYPTYNSSTGNTYFGNPAYVEIKDRPVFAGVSAETGVTFSFTYQPTKDKQYNQLLSFGLNAYNTTDARKRHIYVGATYHATLGGNAPLYIDWIDGSENAHLRAYPSGLTFSNNRTYDVIISISVAEGVVYIIDGVRYNTVYNGSSFEAEKPYITEFLNDIHNYQHNYIGRSRWTGDESFTGNIRDLRLYGGVTAQTVFLSAPDADVEGTTITAAAYGAAMPAVTIPQRTAYTFAGYYDAVSGGTKYYNADGTSARTWNKTAGGTLYARWTPTNYKITYNTDGGDAIAQQTYNVESTARLPGATYTGYTFDDWTATSASGTWTVGANYAKNTSLTNKYGDVTLKANWTINSSDLRIDPNGGTWGGTSDLTTITRDYGEVYTPGDPTPPAGSHFTGWTLVAASLDTPNGSWENGSYTFGPEKDVLDVLEATYTAHTYSGSPVWGAWTQNGDAWTCTATFTCDGCTNTVTPAVTVTPAATDPTCTEGGFTVYTATVTMNGTTYTNPLTKTVDGAPATGHHYNSAPTWGEWTDANTVVATFKCDDCDQTITPEVSVASAETAATCTAAGFTVYTASVIYNGVTYTDPQTKTVPGDPATGHTYAEPSEGDWTWTKTGDTYIATVEVSCVHNDDTTTLTA